MKKLIVIAFALFTTIMFSQTVVSGNVKDANSGEPLPGVNIKVKGKSLGTSTDFDGNYSLKVNQAPPFDVVYTTLGFATQTVNVTTAKQTADVSMSENASALDEVVVSASRTPESVRESPVTIERMDARDIQNTASASFYNSIENLKGVDVNTSSLTFNSVNTRGFATFANTRFVQLVDGMDNASPMLNFVMGNLVGVNELDAASVELMPGASSALYGANAFNGILFMTTKSPFDHQGISTYFKKGITSSEAAGDDAYTDFGIRAAHAFSEKFAAKASFSFLNGTDWLANDTNHYDVTKVGDADTIVEAGDKYTTPAGGTVYGSEGLNVYGDEIALNINDIANSMATGGLIPQFMADMIPSDVVAFTGYREDQVTDYKAQSLKADVSLNYRPFANDLEIIGNYRIGSGNTIYQGANRYQLDGFRIQQMRLEVKNDDFFLRAYKVGESSGESYDMRFTGINLSKRFAGTWYGNYVGAYLGALGGGATDADAIHKGARQFANANALPQPGDESFETAFKEIIANPDVSVGSKFIDNTSMKVGEGNYNFKSLLNDAIDLQVGGNYRQYNLDTGGTIFTDGPNNGGAIKYGEYGVYVQAIKKFMDDRLKLAASVRMDKNDYFDANISPRVSVNYAAGDSKQHNIRASFQTGFRNPDTQALFIGFNVGRAILVGSSPDNLDRILPGTHLTARDAYQDSYTATSAGIFGAAVQAAIPGLLAANPGMTVPQAAGMAGVMNIGLLEVANVELAQPEKVTAIDFGYRGKLGKITVDANVYFNMYDGFLNNQVTLAPNTGTTSDLTTFSGMADVLAGNYQAFQTYTNSSADVNSLGGVIGLSTRVGNGYKVGINYTYSKLDFDQASDPDFTTNFNTPENKIKFSFSNSNVFKNVGFGINGRWSDEYLWQSTTGNAIMDSRFTADAMLNYSMPKWKSKFKIGGSNLGGKDYRSAVGAGNVGSLYYVSWTINN